MPQIRGDYTWHWHLARTYNIRSDNSSASGISTRFDDDKRDPIRLCKRNSPLLKAVVRNHYTLVRTDVINALLQHHDFLDPNWSLPGFALDQS